MAVRSPFHHLFASGHGLLLVILSLMVSCRALVMLLPTLVSWFKSLIGAGRGIVFSFSFSVFLNSSQLAVLKL